VYKELFVFLSSEQYCRVDIVSELWMCSIYCNEAFMLVLLCKCLQTFVGLLVF
jgi:hypothetical protein